MRKFASGLLCLLALLAPRGAAQASAEQRRPSKTPTAILDINHASVEDFATLPGIGPKLAQRIVNFREKHGPFRRVEDLMAIRGVGLKKWKAIRPYIEVRSQKPEGSKQ